MGKDVFVQMRCYGAPCLENALAAAAAALAMGASPSEIARGLEAFQPLPRRLNVISLGQEIHLIDDTYNANPVSMEAALKVLQHLATGRRLAVLGDMRELGEGTRGMHRSIGKKAADLGVDVLIAVGEWAEEMLQGARESSSPPKEIYASATAHEAVDMASETCSRGDWILVKGSRAMALEQVVEGLSRALGLYKPLEQRNAG
jgi:UDP-N-acetylmuramyl pentapeptide synthase